LTGLSSERADSGQAPTPESPFARRLWLAPLTRGGHLAFRRLCVEFGAQVTVGEMALARSLVRGKPSEFALLKGHPAEPLFGVQLAGRDPETLEEAARLAEARGARFVDLNCGCPIRAVTQRGLGAGLLGKPARLGRLVAGIRGALRVPVTVKLRTGWSQERPNVREVARVCEEAGASAIAIHGRSREQRYVKAADWDLIGEVAAERGVLVVGNGDILTHYEARARRERSGVAALMIGRGALIKPWIFRELREDRELLLGAAERVRVYWRFVELLREHFGADARGRARILRFLPWHFGFFSRYRPLPEAEFAESAARHPLLQTRMPAASDLEPLERLLRDPREERHLEISTALLDASCCDEALELLGRLAERAGPVAVGSETPVDEGEVEG
jgi:tRNA-dihydrouridine synthase 3